MMDAESKRKWIEALRSGEYQQGRQLLSQFDESDNLLLCCIGVGFCVAGFSDQLSSHCTSEAARLIGLNELQQCDLVTMNDTDQKSFAEIADYIEANL